jgi:hypothetical protein
MIRKQTQTQYLLFYLLCIVDRERVREKERKRVVLLSVLLNHRVLRKRSKG